MMYSAHSTAMIFGNQKAKFNNDDHVESVEERHETGIFPLWISDEPDSDYIYAIPSYYIAVNRNVVEQNREKGRLLMEIVYYLNRPDAQKQMVSGGMQISNVQGVQVDDFSRDIRETIAGYHISIISTWLERTAWA